MEKTVKVKINTKTGEKTWEVSGVEGGACEDLTEALRRTNEVVAHERTEEFCTVQELPNYLENQQP